MVMFIYWFRYRIAADHLGRLAATLADLGELARSNAQHGTGLARLMARAARSTIVAKVAPPSASVSAKVGWMPISEISFSWM